MALFDHRGQPVNTSRQTVHASRDAGSYRGTIGEWFGPQTHSQAEDTRERGVMQRRAADLAANDWAAHSAVEAITGNAVGTGLVPKSNIPAKILGITPDIAHEIGERLEWCFALWGSEADVRGKGHFVDLQMLGLRTILSMGEMLHVVTRIPEHERLARNCKFSLKLQTLSPQRLMTPADLRLDPAIRDGVRLSDYGRPEGYYLATPKANIADSSLTSDGSTLFLAQDFTYIPAQIGLWPGLFHLYRQETDEQVRGVSAFSKGISLFRNLSDALTYELFEVGRQ